MLIDPELCYRTLGKRDTRFDGRFYVGVTSTGVYCRPICPAPTPRQDRCRFFANAAAAEGHGFRPCLRCRPELAPGNAPMDAVARLAGAALARIEAGALNEGGLEQLAAELDISSRQLRRALEREYGVPPVELAQTQRLLMAKRLLTETSLRIADVAYASGFSSVRRFNHLFRTRYRMNPGALRKPSLVTDGAESVSLKLAYRPPLEWDALLAFFIGRGAAGVDAVEGRRYLRGVRLGAQRGWIAAEPLLGAAALRVEVSMSLLPVLPALLARLRRLFDLDANPMPVAEFLSADPLLREHVRTKPGLRVPGAFDGFELALRAVLGQQISVKAASTVYGRFAQAFGEPLTTPHAAIKLTPPEAGRIAAARPQKIIDLGLTQARAATVLALARAVADGLKLEPEHDTEATVAALKELPGIGDWTAQYVAMRVLRDPDAFPAADLGVLRALGVAKPREALARAEGWRPWRAYATMHLWQRYAQL